jgi:hypothetical protein
MHCGKTVVDTHEVCDFCGTNQLSSLISQDEKNGSNNASPLNVGIDHHNTNPNIYTKCPFCSEKIANDAIKCKHCGSVINQEKLSQTLHKMTGTTGQGSNGDGLSEYYKNAFNKIDANNGTFTIIFNWAALLFGALWYLYKGMWAKGLLMILIGFILAGVPFFFFWIYCALAGTYDYYLLTVKKKQLW